MKFFKNRAAAILIAVVVVLGSGVVSAKAGLDRAVRDVEMLYYDGVEAESGNYLRKSIDSQMRVKYNSLNGMLSVLSAYDELAEVTAELETARDHVYANLGGYDDGTIAGMSAANAELETALTRLRVEMAQVSFPDREGQMLDTYLSDLAGAQSVIQSSGYNEAVREFNSTDMKKFPAEALLPLFGNDQGGASYFN